MNGVTRVSPGYVAWIRDLVRGLASLEGGPRLTVLVSSSNVSRMEGLDRSGVRVVPVSGTDDTFVHRYFFREHRLLRLHETEDPAARILLSPRGVASFRWPHHQVVILDDLTPFSGQLLRSLGPFTRLFRIPFLDSVFRASVERAELTVVHGEPALNALESSGCVPKLAKVVPRGVDDVFFGERGEGGETSVQSLVCVGPLAPYRNLDVVIRALAWLRKEGRDLELDLLGPEVDGRYVARLRSLVDTLGLSGAVRFGPRPPVEELAGIYRRAACLVFLSRFEAFPLELVEAMAAGCPAVVNARIRTRNVSGDLPIRVRPGEPEEVVEGLRRVLDDDELRARVRTEGPRVAEPYRWSLVAREYAWLFQALVEGNVRRGPRPGGTRESPYAYGVEFGESGARSGPES